MVPFTNLWLIHQCVRLMSIWRKDCMLCSSKESHTYTQIRFAIETSIHIMSWCPMTARTSNSVTLARPDNMTHQRTCEIGCWLKPPMCVVEGHACTTCFLGSYPAPAAKTFHLEKWNSLMMCCAGCLHLAPKFLTWH